MDPNDTGHGLPAETALRLLGRLMLAWDGQWFLKVVETCGMEKAVELNARVRTSFGRIEMREFLRAKGREGAESLEEALALMRAYQRLFLGDGIGAAFQVEGQTVEVAVDRCLPQEGSRKAGVRPDTPCVACETVWATWLSALLPGSRWSTEIPASMGRGAARCRILVRREEPANAPALG